MIRIFLSLLLLCLANIAHALCDEAADLPDGVLQTLRAEAAQHPFHQGNLWQVEKAGVTSYLFGTMHLYDPRHAASMERLEPLIARSDQVVIEATRADEAVLQRELIGNPTRYLITEGDSLIDRLGPEAWNKLVPLVTKRGIPAFMAAKFQPWFLGFSMMMPECALSDLQAKRFGIDKSIEAEGEALGKPVSGLDDVMALIDVFSGDPLDEQVDEMRWSLLLDLPMDPSMKGLTAFYFAEETQLAWTYSLQEAAALSEDLAPADQDRLMGLVTEMLDDLITGRNHQWMARLRVELAQTPSFVAVGALHLPGQDGLLQLLQNDGFTVTRLSMDQP
ncbi:TraB/GumN family protein [Thalassobius sp. MITS945101]|uniref:TraB/GumN family protein n=1 Tax=Thalassobius sp. MITS945101 TaxID=3096994 RepID=UPI00399A054F